MIFAIRCLGQVMANLLRSTFLHALTQRYGILLDRSADSWLRREKKIKIAVFFQQVTVEMD